MHNNLFHNLRPIKVFRNVEFVYFQDTDNLSVYLVDRNSSVEEYCEDITKDVLMSYDINDKIVAFHIQIIARFYPFDLNVFNENPPEPVYDENSNILRVNLVYPIL